MKRKLKNTHLIILLVISFLLIITVGVTLANYYTQHKLENNFVTADYNITLSEYFPITIWDDNNILEKKITISNDGSAAVLLRVAYNEMWIDSNGNILNNLYEGKEIVNKNWSNEFISNFQYYDGWYYYKKTLLPEESVVLLNSVEKKIDVYNESGTQYNLDFNYEVLQADNGAAEKVWGYEATIEGSDVIWKY